MQSSLHIKDMFINIAHQSIVYYSQIDKYIVNPGQNVDGQNVDGQNVDYFGSIGQNVDGQNVDGKKKNNLLFNRKYYCHSYLITGRPLPINSQ